MNIAHAWTIAGWTMIHFAWIGTAILIVAALARWLASRAPANGKYVLSLVSLALVTASPVVIAAWLSVTMPAPIATAPPTTTLTDSGAAPQLPAASQIEVDADDLVPAESTSLAAQPLSNSLPEPFEELPAEVIAAAETEFSWALAQTWLAALAAWLPWIWICGAPLMLIVLCGGLAVTGRLRRSARPIAEPQFSAIVARLREQFGIARDVAVAVSDRVRTPILVGIVKPLILLPPAVLGDWTVDAVELALLHELAHVRRWDNLVNLVQRAIESALFFHPAIWITSGWVRHDREECCDALVVAHTGRPREYARLLIDVAHDSTVAHHPIVATAMARHGLAGRVRRILNLPEEPMRVSRSMLLTLAALLVAVLLVPLWLPDGSRADDVEGDAATEANDPFGPSGGDGGSGGLDVQTERVVAQFPADANYAEVAKVIEKLSKANVDIAIRRGEDGSAIVVAIKKSNDGPVSASPDEALSDFDEAGEDTFQFPTLEEQRDRDLVHSLLHFEAEPASGAALAACRDNKFRGGVRVTQPVKGMTHASCALENGDILVGLHVWPTSSIDKLAAVLRREDLADLSPLKYYVLRPEHVRAEPAPMEGRGSGRGGGRAGGFGRGGGEIGRGGMGFDAEAAGGGEDFGGGRSVVGGRGFEMRDAEGGRGGYGGDMGGGGMRGGMRGAGEAGGSFGGFGGGAPPAVYTTTYRLITGRLSISRDAWSAEQLRLSRTRPVNEINVSNVYQANNAAAKSLAHRALSALGMTDPFDATFGNTLAPTASATITTSAGTIEVEVDQRTNTVILRGPKSQVDELVERLEKLDEPSDPRPAADNPYSGRSGRSGARDSRGLRNARPSPQEHSPPSGRRGAMGDLFGADSDAAPAEPTPLPPAERSVLLDEVADESPLPVASRNLPLPPPPGPPAIATDAGDAVVPADDADADAFGAGPAFGIESDDDMPAENTDSDAFDAGGSDASESADPLPPTLLRDEPMAGGGDATPSDSTVSAPELMDSVSDSLPPMLVDPPGGDAFADSHPDTFPGPAVDAFVPTAADVALPVDSAVSAGTPAIIDLGLPSVGLQYDGKQLGEWQQEWRRELSPKRHVAAIEAFAAFARAGKQQKAAMEILDLAVRYNWKPDPNISSDEVAIHRAVGKAFHSGEFRGVPQRVWIAELERRLKKDPNTYGPLARHLISVSPGQQLDLDDESREIRDRILKMLPPPARTRR